MNFVAIKILTGDRAKYLGLILAIGFASMLMAHQASIVAGLMWPTPSEIQDVRDAGSAYPPSRRGVTWSAQQHEREPNMVDIGNLGLWQPAALPRGRIHPTEVCL